MTKHTTVSSKAMRSALMRLAEAVEAGKRQAGELEKEASRVLKDLNEGRRPSYGYSNQTLIQSAASLATLEATIAAAVSTAASDADREAIDAIFADTDLVWGVEVAR
jgi:hypothetical protein